MRSKIKKLAFNTYYVYCSLVDRLLPSITLEGKRLRILPGVYKPFDHEQGIADLLEPGKHVLDMGCGSGVITVFAAPKSHHVTAADISSQAIKNTRLNCDAHGIENVTIVQSDMYQSVVGKFDYIVSYPPLFRLSFASPDRQWCTSTTFVDQLVAGAAEHLNPGGRLIILLPMMQEAALQDLADAHHLVLERLSHNNDRDLATRIHSLAYFHFDMKSYFYVLRVADHQTLTQPEAADQVLPV